MAKPHWQEEEDILVEDDIGSDHPSYLIVFNDDVNSFEWVIQCFMEILKHTSEQAEQLSIIIHFKGKATVKTGPKNELVPLCEGLLDRGLSAVVEEE
ncbi:MAG: ATP-dependent Clp protease adaptor ClpS [Bacteroidetes bacterium]|nr:MAG: ATP-dependent Clp protease adaptor ClpS [Bacteroidota bacterium]